MLTSDMKRQHQDLLLMAYRASTNGNEDLEKECLAEAKKIEILILEIEKSRNRKK